MPVRIHHAVGRSALAVIGLSMFVACQSIASGPAPRQGFAESEPDETPLDEFQANVEITARVDHDALRRPGLSATVDTQIAAMIAYVRAHGQGELHRASLDPALAPGGGGRRELRRLAGIATHLFAHLDYDDAPRELSRVAFAALAERLAGDAVYEQVDPSETTLAGNDLVISQRDGIGLLALRHMDDTLGDRVAAVLGQWTGSDRPPRAILIDLSGCEFASPAAAAGLVNTFAPGRAAFALESREPDGAELERKTFQGDAAWGAGAYAKTPLFILTSERTGSVAEAAIHALRHHRGARVLGTPTRGDGRLMIWFRLPARTRFGFAVAELYGLDGETLRGRPVIPDACEAAGGIVALAPRTAEEFRARCTGAELAREAAIDHVRELLAADAAESPASHGTSEEGRVKS
jgi:hypothetical protein